MRVTGLSETTIGVPLHGVKRAARLLLVLPTTTTYNPEATLVEYALARGRVIPLSIACKWFDDDDGDPTCYSKEPTPATKTQVRVV